LRFPGKKLTNVVFLGGTNFQVGFGSHPACENDIWAARSHVKPLKVLLEKGRCYIELKGYKFVIPLYSKFTGLVIISEYPGDDFHARHFLVFCWCNILDSRFLETSKVHFGESRK